MKKILVTGGAGFIGSHFINLILDENKDIEVINFDNLTYAANLNNVNTSKKHTFIEGNIGNEDDLNNLFSRYSFDAVINFAAETHVDKSIENPFIFTETNLLGFQKLFYKAMDNEVKRFIQISTDEVYGPNENSEIFDENSSLKPDNPYSVSKAGADMIVKSAMNTFGYKGIIVRSSNNYGINQYPEKLIPLSIKRLISGEKIKLYGDGNQKRDWLSVTDNVNIIKNILFSGIDGEIYNICTGVEKKNIDVAKLIIKSLNELLGTKYSEAEDIEFVEDRKGHDYRYTMSNYKVMREIKVPGFNDFDSGINDVVRHYLAKYGVLK
ncbi:MAG: GDP-mannose 4,6-dehydratase [Bacillota bacterium]|nr:GDP-mannose 4,6-dehydratase [Bacillota bacterium]